MTLCKNVGTIDRTVRAVIGIAALALAFVQFNIMQGSVPGIIAGVIGLVLLLTAAIGTCPLYIPLKLSTCKAIR